MVAHFAFYRENSTDVFYAEYQNDYCFPHFHSPIEIYIVTDGEMEIEISGKGKTLKGGSAAISFSFDIQKYKTPKYSKSRVFIVPVQNIPEIEMILDKKQCKSPFITDKAAVDKIIALIDTYNNPALSEIEKKGYLYLILGEVLKNLEFEEKSAEISVDLSKKILFYLEEHFTEQITLETVAQHFGYNYNYMSRYFKECFGVNFNRYLNHLRLSHAVKLMENEQNSIIYCAMESGFCSVRSFYRAFSAEFSQTPKEYMKKIKRHL